MCPPATTAHCASFHSTKDTHGTTKDDRLYLLAPHVSTQRSVPHQAHAARVYCCMDCRQQVRCLFSFLFLHVSLTCLYRYIVSGSDEMNLRLWKSTASERLGAKAARQLSAIKYQETVKNRFIHHPEIRRISRSASAHVAHLFFFFSLSAKTRHRRLPKAIFKARAQKHAIQTSEVRLVLVCCVSC